MPLKVVGDALRLGTTRRPAWKDRLQAGHGLARAATGQIRAAAWLERVSDAASTRRATAPATAPSGPTTSAGHGANTSELSWRHRKTMWPRGPGLGALHGRCGSTSGSGWADANPGKISPSPGSARAEAMMGGPGQTKGLIPTNHRLCARMRTGKSTSGDLTWTLYIPTGEKKSGTKPILCLCIHCWT